MNKELLYYIPSGEFGKEGVLSLLRTHPEIRFVSLVGIDLAGNDTDEKIPIEIFMKDYDVYERTPGWNAPHSVLPSA